MSLFIEAGTSNDKNKESVNLPPDMAYVYTILTGYNSSSITWSVSVM
jgi:hypothetical protein